MMYNRLNKGLYFTQLILSSVKMLQPNFTPTLKHVVVVLGESHRETAKVAGERNKI